jgi:hypothetical protein
MKGDQSCEDNIKHRKVEIQHLIRKTHNPGKKLRPITSNTDGPSEIVA